MNDTPITLSSYAVASGGTLKRAGRPLRCTHRGTDCPIPTGVQYVSFPRLRFARTADRACLTCALTGRMIDGPLTLRHLTGG